VVELSHFVFFHLLVAIVVICIPYSVGLGICKGFRDIVKENMEMLLFPTFEGYIQREGLCY